MIKHIWNIIFSSTKLKQMYFLNNEEKLYLSVPKRLNEHIYFKIHIFQADLNWCLKSN